MACCTVGYQARIRQIHHIIFGRKPGETLENQSRNSGNVSSKKPLHESLALRPLLFCPKILPVPPCFSGAYRPLPRSNGNGKACPTRLKLIYQLLQDRYCPLFFLMLKGYKLGFIANKGYGKLA